MTRPRPGSFFPIRPGMPVGAVLMLVALAGSSRAQTTAFSHDAARVPTGTLHAYVKSNLDGSQAIRVLVWTAGPDCIEVLKLEPENHSAAFVTAHIDWAAVSADRLESAVLFPDGSRREQAKLVLDPATRRVTVEVFGLVDSLTVGALPVHMYNFDFLSLAAVLPHLNDPDTPFTIGVMNPTFASEPPLLVYEGEIRVEPTGYEQRAGVRARRYRISGEGMRDAEAWLWTAADDGRLLAIESPVPDNPGWSSFRLDLRSTTRLDDAGWRAQIEQEVAALAAPDSALSATIAADADSARLQIAAFFGGDFRHPVAIRVFPDRPSFDAYTTETWGFATECWMVGAGATRSLVILSPRVWKSQACDHDPDDPDELRDLIAHELVHSYHMQRNPSNEFEGADEIGWFVEGLATYVSGQLDRGQRARAIEALATNETPARLDEAWSGPYRYGVSGTLVEYVDATWGRDVLLSLLEATSQEHILRALGVEEQELLEGWRAWLEGHS